MLTEDALRAAGVRLHPGSHLYRLAWKAERGHHDSAGFLSDAECDAAERAIAEAERSWREEQFAFRRMTLMEKAALFGFMVEVDPPGSGGGADREEVRARVDLVELVSQATALRVVGDRATGRCPFHDDRAASFSVDRRKGVWHCFAGCGGGDVFSYIMKRCDVPFREALEIASRL